MKFKAVKGIEANMSRGLLRIFSVPTIAKKGIEANMSRGLLRIFSVPTIAKNLSRKFWHQFSPQKRHPYSSFLKR
jgi:hypothetical protein